MIFTTLLFFTEMAGSNQPNIKMGNDDSTTSDGSANLTATAHHQERRGSQQ